MQADSIATCMVVRTLPQTRRFLNILCPLCEYSHLLASSVTSPNQKSNKSPKRKTKQEQKNDQKTRRIKQTQYYDIQDSHKIHRKQTD